MLPERNCTEMMRSPQQKNAREARKCCTDNSRSSKDTERSPCSGGRRNGPRESEIRKVTLQQVNLIRNRPTRGVNRDARYRPHKRLLLSGPHQRATVAPLRCERNGCSFLGLQETQTDASMRQHGASSQVGHVVCCIHRGGRTEMRKCGACLASFPDFQHDGAARSP